MRHDKRELLSNPVALTTLTPPVRKRIKTRRCNLCAEGFRPHTAFERYCSSCKKESELLRFSEWLPELDNAIAERLTA